MSPEEWLASQTKQAAPAEPAPAAATTAAPVATRAPASAPVAPTPASAAAAMSPEQWAASQSKPMGFFEGLVESVTGRARATPETQSLPEWTSMPELSQMSMASFKSALGTLLTNPQETVQIMQANFPGLQARQDAKGNYILRSSVNQKEYAIPPGASVGDIPRILGGLFAFTPAGRAATIPGAVVGAGATQAVIEATQAATGGQISPAEIGLAAATGPAGQIIQRVAPPVVAAVRRGAQRVTGRAPAPAPAPGAPGAPMGTAMAPETRIEPTFETPPLTAVVPEAPPAAAAIPEAPPAAAPAIAPTVAAEATEVGVGDVLNLARKAGGMGPGSTAAKAKLIDLAQVNPEARAAAERLNIELPFDVFSDNPQVRSAVGLTRALVAGEAEAAWEGTVRAAVQRADEVSQQFDAAFIEGRPATGATSQKILDSLKSTRNNVQQEASDLYKQVDAVVPKSFPASTDNLAAELAKIKEELGASAAGIKSLKKLDDMVNSGMTYGGVSFEKSMLGAAKRAGTTNEYATNLNTGTIKRLEAAIAKDQLDTVEAFGGEEIRRQLRTANLLTAKQKALEERLVGAFGKDIDGSVAQRMQTAITTASKGDAAAFNKLMKVVPEDLRRETIATALASVTAGKAAGRAAAGAAETVFSPAEYTKVYRGLRANPPVYSQMVKIMGPEWDRASRDLYEISRRIADAQARIPTTGKANQILGEAAVEGLMGKVMSSSLAQRAATGVASMVPGGGLVAPDIVQWMSASKGAGVQKAAKLFASPEFQELAVQSATKGGNPSQAAIRKTAMSKAFGDFAREANLPQSLDARIQYLQSAIQAGRQFDQEQQQ